MQRNYIHELVVFASYVAIKQDLVLGTHFWNTLGFKHTPL